MVSYLVLDHPLLFYGILFTMAFGLSTLISKLNIALPHILYYILTGFIVGNFFFDHELSNPQITEWFHTIEIFALGLIGFQIGTELHFNLMKKEPKLISVLLIANVAGAFILTYVLVFFFTQDMLLSIMLAALATSTAPATTVGVIKKLNAKGPLTQRVQWVLAFDDVVSIAVVEAFLIVVVINLGGDPSIAGFFKDFGQEIGLAIVFGLIIGLALNYVVERMDNDLEMMEMTFAVVLLSIGLAEYIHTSAISIAMVIGATVTNTGGDNYEDAHDLLDILASPILAFFFILIGAKIQIGDFYDPFPWIALVYFLARAIGKVYGTYLGAHYLGLEEPMKSGLGYSLVAQGGVVLGLASLASEIFTDLGNADLGNRLLSAVVISTVLSEIVGALGTDYAIKKNEEDFPIT